MAEASPPSVRLEFLLAADIESVYGAWTDEAVLRQWFGPSEGIEAEVELDLRIGGRYRITMGSRTTRGEYLEITPPRRLSFTWTWDDEPEVETRVTIELEPEGEHTRMVLEHEQLPLEVDCMGFEMGWRRSIAKLERHFSARTS